MNSNPPSADTLLRFWQPRFWPVWVGYGLLRLLVLLPYALQMRIGAGLGHAGRLLMPRRRAVVAANLRLCFPALSQAEREELSRRHFASLGMQVVEMGLINWGSERLVRRLITIEGLEHLQRATAGGKGAILLSGHFSPVEFSGRRLKQEFPGVAAMYRPTRNPLVDAMIRRIRIRTVSSLIPKDSIRQLLRRLSQGTTVWYAPDQSYRRNYAVLAPFFGEPAMTNAALTHIARISGAAVVPYYARRLAGGRGYQVTIEPALENFPSGEAANDAQRINAILERWIRQAPEQYYWIHRRFKGRPEGFPDPYAGG